VNGRHGLRQAVSQRARRAMTSPLADRSPSRCFTGSRIYEETRRLDEASPGRADRLREGRAMLQSGRIVFGKMETVVFGRPAAEIIAEEVAGAEAERVY